MAGVRSSRASDTPVLTESMGSRVRLTCASELYPTAEGKGTSPLPARSLLSSGHNNSPFLRERQGRGQAEVQVKLSGQCRVSIIILIPTYQLFPRLEGPSQRYHHFPGILVLIFGVLHNFLLLSFHLPHSPSLSLPPIILFTLKGRVPALRTT